MAIIFIEYENIQEKIRIYLDQILSSNALINGKTLISLGYIPNSMFKNYLNKIYKIQLDNPNLSADELIVLWKMSEGDNN